MKTTYSFEGAMVPEKSNVCENAAAAKSAFLTCNAILGTLRRRYSVQSPTSGWMTDELVEPVVKREFLGHLSRLICPPSTPRFQDMCGAL